MPTVKIEGQLSHLIGSMLPSAGAEAKFLQIYFIGNLTATHSLISGKTMIIS